ncbi:hypothetical protein DPSP01_004228 [Paraphaeosphaeria sporulosa]
MANAAPSTTLAPFPGTHIQFAHSLPLPLPSLTAPANPLLPQARIEYTRTNFCNGHASSTSGVWHVALTGAFNGFIGYHNQVHPDGKNGGHAWRWIFLIEDVVPVAWGFVVAALQPSTPETVQFIFTRSGKETIIIQRSRSRHNN